VAGVKRTLAVDLAGLGMVTPVMIASGCAGTGRELSGLVDLRKVGAVVSRTVTVAPRKGAPTPRVAEARSSIVWETGWQNPGLDAFVDEELPRLARHASPVVVSIGGSTLEEFVRLSSALQGRQEVAALEVQLALPDVELGHRIVGASPDRVAETVGAVARMSTVPVFAKLPGAAGDPVELAHAAARAGASGVTVGGPMPAAMVDVTSLRASLGAVTGWLSGPALLPQTVRTVFEVAQALPSLPVLAGGGVATGEDAVACLLAGATAVQVGTATLVDAGAPVEIAKGIARYLKAKNVGAPEDLRGRVRVPAAAGPPDGETP
jgi:dihydroorotate dehydrogenase (NAD+) catalytic subunit